MFNSETNEIHWMNLFWIYHDKKEKEKNIYQAAEYRLRFMNFWSFRFNGFKDLILKPDLPPVNVVGVLSKF